MIRKLVVALLIGAMCLTGASLSLAKEVTNIYATPKAYTEATGKSIAKFNEAPMLRVKVAAGEIPPVDERLPEEPLIEEPIEEIGTYGGTLRTALHSAKEWSPTARSLAEFMLMPDHPMEKIYPNIAKGWKFSNDKKTFTLYLRKGMKWSDGMPFTTDDILFLWEDVILNKELIPVIPQHWIPGDELMKVEKVDDYTVRFHFAKPYSRVIYYISGFLSMGAQADIYLPRHFFEKLHIKYNPEADELAKKEGYDTWWQLFISLYRYGGYSLGSRIASPEYTLQIPTLAAWVVKEISSAGTIWERNPYYFKVDTAGNQLPYIDKIQALSMGGNMEIWRMKAITGELDIEHQPFTLQQLTVLRENEKEGGYRTILGKNIRETIICAYWCNQNYKEDPVLGEILRDVRFRQALSLATNRDEINEIMYYGKATPRQATVLTPPSELYEERWAEAYAQYNLKKANTILDEMGLKWDSKHEYRLRPDGKTLSLAVLMSTWHVRVTMSQIVREDWEKVGIKTDLKVVSGGAMNTMVNTGEFQVMASRVSNTSDAAVVAGRGFGYAHALGLGRRWCNEWTRWWDIKEGRISPKEGEEGEEPPEWCKRLFSLSDSLGIASEEEILQIMKEMAEIQAERLISIGTVGYEPVIMIANIGLGNIQTPWIYGAIEYVTGHLECLFWKE